MGTYALKADRFFLPGAPMGPGYLPVEDGRFGLYTSERPSCEVKDYSGSWVAPGLVDTHIHGMLDHDVMDCDWDGMADICEGLVRYGVTSWLPTTLTASVEQTGEACAIVGSHASESRGARIQGIFLEGPFFTEKHKGAQNPAYFLDPDVGVFDRWQEQAGGIIKKIAIAPERAGAPAFCGQVARRGVAIALGHSDATYEEAVACVNAGASVFVHTYNGMSPLHHREPGMVGTAMATNGTYAELICDGHHIDPVSCGVLVSAKGWDHVVLITDCMRAGGMPDGSYHLGDFPVDVRDGAARLTDGSNSLAGSILTLDKAMKNVFDWGLVTAEQAVRMATENPARANGISGECGSILPGRAADLVVLGTDLSLEETYLGGKSVWRA